MIDKPIHRRHAFVSADRRPSSGWHFFLLPCLLLVEAIFIGTTFYTLPATMGTLLFALLVVGLVLQARGGQSGVVARVKHSAASDRKPPVADQAGDASNHFLLSAEQTQRRTARLELLRTLMVIPAVLIVAALFASTRVLHHISGNLNPVAMMVDVIAHAVFITSLVLWVCYPRRGHPAMLGCGLLLVLTTVTAGGVSHTINGQLVAAMATVIAFAFAADHILGHWQVDRANRRRRRMHQHRITPSRSRQGRFSGQLAEATSLPSSTVSVSSSRGRSPMLYSVLALSILLMSTSATGHLASHVVPGLQLDFFDRLSQSLEAVTANTIIGGSRYVRGSRLGSIREHMIGDPADPAVSAYATTMPGYLRGTVFDTYKQGRWSAASDRVFDAEMDASAIRSRVAEIEMPGTTPIQGSLGGERLSRFRVRKNPGGKRVGTIEVRNVPLKGRLVFSSLSAEWMEASTFGATTISHQDIVTKGVDTREPYVLGITSETPQEKLESLRRSIMLRLPPQLTDSIRSRTRSICGPHLTARSKARAIEDYFQANYSYSLNSTTVPGEVDPIVNFLKTQHSAHCEFFASAAAVMLRTEGIPTRYVTGYVVSELSEDGKYWLARNRDAHAWVEAYDDITEQWFPVEATVGRTYRTLTSETNTLDDTGGSLAGFLDDADDRTLFGRIVGWLLSFRATDSLTWIFRIAQLPLFCLVVALLWIRQRRKFNGGDDPTEHASRQMLHRVDRRVRKYAFVRAKGETLHQFASRLESAARDQPDSVTFLQTAAHWYRGFAADRYRGLMPTPID